MAGAGGVAVADVEFHSFVHLFFELMLSANAADAYPAICGWLHRMANRPSVHRSAKILEAADKQSGGRKGRTLNASYLTGRREVSERRNGYSGKPLLVGCRRLPACSVLLGVLEGGKVFVVLLVHSLTLTLAHPSSCPRGYSEGAPSCTTRGAVALPLQPSAAQ